MRVVDDGIAIHVLEFVAPSEYMVRPPQPPSHFFVIDVSLTSVRSGMLTSVAHAQVGFLTYDESVGGSNLNQLRKEKACNYPQRRYNSVQRRIDDAAKTNVVNFSTTRVLKTMIRTESASVF